MAIQCLLQRSRYPITHSYTFALITATYASIHTWPLMVTRRDADVLKIEEVLRAVAGGPSVLRES